MEYLLGNIIYLKQPPEVFYEINALRNFAKLTGKHLCWILFFFSDLRPATLLKKRFQHRCFLVNFTKLLRKPNL